MPPHVSSNGHHPSRIGRYAIGECIGRGALGSVYAAVDESIGRQVAVRVGASGDLRVHQQAKATAQVAHPNIVSVLDLGEDGATPYAVMERLDGQPLDDTLRPLEEQLDVMLRVCDGLQAAHARGVIHGGLRPGHVFVQRDGAIKLMDFSSDGRGGAYAAPEQLDGAATERSDIYSAGAVFTVLLSGESPDPLRATVLKATQKDPQRRHVSIEHLRAEIDQVRQTRAGDRQRVLAAALDRYRDIESLLAQRRALGRRLGAPAIERECDARLARLAAAFPEFARSGLDISNVGDIDTSRVAAALTELQIWHNDVAAEVAVLRAASGETP